MRKLSTIALSLFCLFTGTYSSAQSYNIILGKPSATSITVSILFNQQTEVYWEYGVSPGDYTSSTATLIASKETPLEAEFAGLTPDTKYYYLTRYRANGATTSAQMDALHKDYRPYLGSICHSIPLFICLGNHEGEKAYYLKQNPPENIAVYATLWRKFVFAHHTRGEGRGDLPGSPHAQRFDL